MKKQIYLLGMLLLLASASAQQKKTTVKKTADASNSSFYKTPYASRNSGSFDKGTHLISLTYGVPNTMDYTGYFFDGNETSAGPVSLRYEFPIREEAGVGLSVSGATHKYDYFGGTNKATGIAVSPLGFYHFNKLIPVSKLDVYAGIGASINFYTYDYDDVYEEDSEMEVYPAGLVGARYYFTKGFSGMLEVGEGSFSVFRFGVSFRL